MAADCYCDLGETPRVYHAARPKARAAHQCDECGRTIHPGERYERVRAIWEDTPYLIKTCVYCLAMRDLLEAHAKCFCWMHHSLRDDIRDWLDEHGLAAGGLAFALGRIEVERRREATERQNSP
jgi:methionyl-tRNA synthetase